MAESMDPFAFRGSLFRLISPHTYLRQHLLQETSLRPSGRNPSDSRPLTLTTGSLSHAHGSAVVRAGDTAVVCGVRGEVLTLDAGDDPLMFETYKRRRSTGAGGASNASSGGAGWGGLIVPNIEMSTGCSKNYPLGPPNDFAQTLAHRIHDLLEVTKLVDLKSLRICGKETESPSSDSAEAPPGAIAPQIKGYWTLYLDVLCISLDGNIFDTAWMAIISALSTTRLPRAEWNIDASRILCSAAPEWRRSVKLRRDLPFVTTFAAVRVPLLPALEGGVHTTASNRSDEHTSKTFVLNDPDAFEESVASEFLTVAVSHRIEELNSNEGPKIERIEKNGDRNLSITEMKNCIESSARRVRYMAEMVFKETNAS